MHFRTMVVDDEPIVTDWVSHLLNESFGSDMEIYKHNDATLALRHLFTGIYDIVILDINMPEITGIDILKELELQKIETQIIFLTAHSEFSYAKRAITPQVVAYILKGEPDSILLQAVRAAMKRIKDKIETENLVKIANSRIQASATNIRREYVIQLLQGLIDIRQDEPTISLLITPLKPVMILICALNTTDEQYYSAGVLLEIGNHIEDYLGRFFLFEGAMLQNNSFVWLMQPKDSNYTGSYPVLLTAIESAQMLFNRHTGQDLLFVYSSAPFKLSDTGKIYRQLLPMQRFGYGKGHIVLTEEDLPEAVTSVSASEDGYEQISRNALMLQNLIENREQNESLSLLEELLTPFEKKRSSSDPLLLETFCFISGIFLAILNKTGSYMAASEAQSLAWLGNSYVFSNWEEAAAAIRHLTEQLLKHNVKKRDNRSQACVDKAREYIAQNLDQDLSLVFLAEKVYLNPSYFSILFKRKVGCNVSDYIKAERLKKARQQLVDTRLKINEIAKNVGYPNAAYFGKFIKQETGLTPLEYRDRYST